MGLCLVLLLLLWSIAAFGENRNRSDPDYGKTWMYIPNGDGVPEVANLTDHPDDERMFVTDENTIEFHLYTRNNPVEYSLLTLYEPEDDASDDAVHVNDTLDVFERRRDVKVLVHGWRSDGNTSTMLDMKDAYLRAADLNVIIVDWGQIAATLLYLVSAYGTKTVGRRTAVLIDALVLDGRASSYDVFHLVGHSLGAHVAGYAGNYTGGRVGRITGLDPARPGFEHLRLNEHRLGAGDARFVDVIHTAVGMLGYSAPMGDADFYPNGGAPPQPGCQEEIVLLEACSHSRSHVYFQESIAHPRAFPSTLCRDPDDISAQGCGYDAAAIETTVVFMGEYVDQGAAREVYYTETNASAPYGQGETD